MPVMITTIRIARSRILVGSALLALLALAACSGVEEDKQDAPPARSAADAPPPPAPTNAAHADGSMTVAGVTFMPPAGWQDIGPEGMRQAQYRLTPVEGDSAPGEVNVFYFGPNSGGGVEANLQRWIGQITPEAGGAAPERGTFTANGLPGHVVSVNGSYKSGGGRPMGGDGEILPGYRLVGVVVEGPQGSVFFKLTGPLATVQAMEGDLMTMVNGAH